MSQSMLLAWVVTVSSFITVAAVAQRETFVPANDVSFTIWPERNVYRVGEQIVVNYKIRNTSNAEIFVPREWSVTCPASPHVWAWFENGTGHHIVPGYAGDCSPEKQTLLERMKREAVLLKPGQQLQNHTTVKTNLFGGMKPGAYRIEAVLYGWNDKEFDQAEQSELQTMGAPFLRGEVPASARVRLR